MNDVFGSDLSDIEGSLSGSVASRTPSPPPVASRGYDERSSATPPPKVELSDSSSSGTGRRQPAPSHGSRGGVDDLFGSDSDSGSAPRGRGDGSASEPSGDERMADEEDEGREQVRVMSARVPVLPRPHSSEGRYVLARTPNIMQLEPTPFSADAYHDLLAEEHRAAEKHGIKAAVSPELATAAESILANTIRWRRVAAPDGTVRRETNARIVRWSDGSMTVVVGGGGAAPEQHSVGAEQLAGVAKEQYSYVAAHQTNELLMQSHARLTESWLIRPPRQSAQVRAAVAQLLDRGRARAEGKAPQGPARAAGARVARTRFMVVGEDPELRIKREEKEEEKRERQRRKEERLRERQVAREFHVGRGGYGAAGAAEYSDEDIDVGYASGGGGGGGTGSHARDRARAPRRLPARLGGPRTDALAPNDYMDEDGDGFIVDDDAELEVGSRDEFDDEEEELAAQRLRDAKRTGGSESDDGGPRGQPRARGGRSRRLASDDDDDDVDDF